MLFNLKDCSFCLKGFSSNSKSSSKSDVFVKSLDAPNYETNDLLKSGSIKGVFRKLKTYVNYRFLKNQYILESKWLEGVLDILMFVISDPNLICSLLSILEELSSSLECIYVYISFSKFSQNVLLTEFIADSQRYQYWSCKCFNGYKNCCLKRV